MVEGLQACVGQRSSSGANSAAGSPRHCLRTDQQRESWPNEAQAQAKPKTHELTGKSLLHPNLPGGDDVTTLLSRLCIMAEADADSKGELLESLARLEARLDRTNEELQGLKRQQVRRPATGFGADRFGRRSLSAVLPCGSLRPKRATPSSRTGSRSLRVSWSRGPATTTAAARPCGRGRPHTRTSTKQSALHARGKLSRKNG